VAAFLPHQIVVCAFFNDDSILNHHDPGASLHSSQSVSYDDGGPILHDVVQGRLDFRLTFFVKSTCGLIQHEDLGVPDNGSGDGNPLLLSSW